MSQLNLTARPKPAKPYPEFPLFPHATGRWAKKIRGAMHYFGPWADPDGALEKYLAQKDALHSGRKLRTDADAVTVKVLINDFLNRKQALVDSAELSLRTWRDYKETCDTLVSCLGKHRLAADVGPDDFASLRTKFSKRWGLHRVAKNIQYTRSVFKHGFEVGLLDRPMRFGPGFARPSKRTFRLERAAQGTKLFTRAEIIAMLAAAGTQLKAMILLGINAGFGNADCGHLPLSSIDFDTGLIDFPRPKTGIKRRCTLWPETVQALRDALADRPEPKRATHAALVFITARGGSWSKDTSDNPIAKEMAKLLKGLKTNARKGLGFYTLRHTFRTVADESKDQPANDFIMGHEVPHMAAVYRETISDERLKAVTDYVRRWLFGESSAMPPQIRANLGRRLSGQ